jgi:uncharacterized protein YodC (DUF2158 family)
MKQKTFKIGDKVYTTKNSSWGMSPMMVVGLFESGCVRCKNPDFSGVGAFRASELEIYDLGC